MNKLQYYKNLYKIIDKIEKEIIAEHLDLYLYKKYENGNNPGITSRIINFVMSEYSDDLIVCLELTASDGSYIDDVYKVFDKNKIIGV